MGCFGAQWSDADVGSESGSMYGHFEVIPVKMEPYDDDVNYDRLDSPECVDMVGSIDNVIYWVRRYYNVLS